MSITEENEKIMCLNVKAFCEDILGIDDEMKHNNYKVIATRDENWKEACDSTQYANLEGEIWHSLFYFKWKRLANLIPTFHNVTNASNQILYKLK